MDKALKVAKDYAFPGCCGVTHIHQINPEAKKTAFLKYLKETDESFGLGGMVTVVSKIKDSALTTKLKEFGFTLVYKSDAECLWIRRVRYGH